ncbi:NAD(P)-dependent oxidoreductase [Sulfitobacter aestuarii]|uniref:NAD(P)-dependent oxidoreductase n=1 Tax=Sulfitobacter aestuarii TaxID=2161676 RepID=A0ABW5U6W3_9RHOB
MTARAIPQVPPRKLAFIGLGTMGSGMAARLLAAGHEVHGYDLDRERLVTFSALGGIACESIAEACAGADCVMTILPRDEHVRTVWLGSGGVLESVSVGTLLIEMSTILPKTSLELHEQAAAAGMRMLDAPVGRTPRDAQNGSLLIMAGGAREYFDEAETVFAPIAEKSIFLGPKGSGIRMKIANNYMSMVGMVLTAETLTLARKAGIDASAAVEVLQNTTAGKGQVNVNYPAKVLSGDVSPDFPLSMGHKDISLGLTLGQELGVPLLLGASARELFGMAAPMRIEDLDCTAMLLIIERLAGLSASVELDERAQGGKPDALQ